jgi:hypothetical protein
MAFLRKVLVSEKIVCNCKLGMKIFGTKIFEYTTADRKREICFFFKSAYTQMLQVGIGVIQKI